MSEVPTTIAAPLFTGWLFGTPPIVRLGDDGRLILAQSRRSRILFYVQMILLVALTVMTLLELPWKFSTLSGAIVLLGILSIYSLLRSIRSVNFDNRQRQMTIRYFSGLFRARRQRSLADLHAIHVMKFRGPSATHVRMVFDQSEPCNVLVAAFRNRTAANEFAQQFSSHLGVPLEEVDYPTKKPLSVLLGCGCLVVLVILLGEAVYYFR